MTTIYIIAIIYLLGLIFNSWTLFEETCDDDPFRENNKSSKSFVISIFKWMFWPIAICYKQIKS